MKEANVGCINLKICAMTGRVRNASGIKVAHILVTKCTMRPSYLPVNFITLCGEP